MPFQQTKKQYLTKFGLLVLPKNKILISLLAFAEIPQDSSLKTSIQSLSCSLNHL